MIYFMRLAFFPIIILFAFSGCTYASTDKISYWDKQQTGANIFNENIHSDIWEAAHKAHIKIIRLAPDKWHGAQKDFLIGNADNYQGLVQSDLLKLKRVLAEANQHDIKIVLTMLSLPGDRWRQLNHFKDDSRIWKEQKYQDQAIKFWQDLAKALKDNPAVIGYNIINEPHPEIALGYKDFTTQNFTTFAQKAFGTHADLNQFYQKIVTAIRQVDTETPIILDVGMYADPRAFSYFKPVVGKNILYAFHFYEPYAYTNYKLNNGKYAYPGKMPVGSNNQLLTIDKAKLTSLYFDHVIEWQEHYHIPSQRIFVAEFGGNRKTAGLATYFNDLISVFNANRWHWAFYAFREDAWDGMDYELGSKPLGVSYWQAIQQGKKPTLTRVPNPIWQVLENNLHITKNEELKNGT